MDNRQSRRKKLLRLDPLVVLSTAVGSLLIERRSVLTSEEFNLLQGSLRARNWKNLLSWANAQGPIPEDHTEYDPSPCYLVKRELAALIRKFAFTPEESGLDPEGEARRTFMRSEHRCRRTNQMMRLLCNRLLLERNPGKVPDRYQYMEVVNPVKVIGKRVELYSFLCDARKYIADVLGATPDMEAIYQACDFGGGASIGVHGNATNIGRKFLSKTWSCTPTAAPYAFAALMSNQHAHRILCPIQDDPQLVALETYRAAFSAKLRLIDYNKLEFVPKSAKTHRVIATEPLLNGLLQKGIDTVMRRKLRAAGVDLKYGWAMNQHWAKLGSLHENFATLDLSAASDSISIQLAKFLLPPRWFALLNNVRSPGYRFVQKGQKIDSCHTVRTEKFCSMGNGFCFPLETLIFAAFARVACAKSLSPIRFLIYGDDIIVPTSVTSTLVNRLEAVGFRLNLDKSYVTGPFRESCGADWVRGRNVTPVYMRKRITTIKQLVDFHNSLQSCCFGEPMKFPGVTKALRQLVPLDQRLVELYRPGQKPLNHGFLVAQDEFMANPHTRWVRETQHWESLAYKTSVVPDEFAHPLRNEVEYIAVLRGASSETPLALRRETRTRTGFVSKDQYERDRHLMVASRRYLPLFKP